MREKTTSHDIHFGHFMAACEHRQNILVHYIMAEIPFRTGFAPSKWKSATNVMILKKAGLFDIDKLRTLCLFQANHNHNNKFLGQQMMEHAMKTNSIAQEQYSVTGRRSISHALNKVLFFDHIRYQKYSACLTSCDLKSCYDRIVHTPAMLAAQSLGVPAKPLISFLQLFKKFSIILEQCMECQTNPLADFTNSLLVIHKVLDKETELLCNSGLS